MTPVVSWCIHRYQTVAISPGYQACLLFTQQKKQLVKQARITPSSEWIVVWLKDFIFLQNKCLKLDMNKSCISSYVVYH